MGDKILGIDGNFYLHRVWFTMRTSRPIEDVLPKAFVGLVMKDACAVNATHLLVAFDGPSVFRYSIFPDYKASRNKEKTVASTDEEVPEVQIYSYLPHIRAMLEKCGIIYTQPKRHEADDVLASMSWQYGSLPNTKVVMGSGDKDGYQSLRSNVIAYNSSQNPPDIITCAVAEKRKGISVSKMVMYQTLIGDGIDDIPQLMKPAAARKIINRWGTFKEWFANADKDEKRWLRANQVALSLNKKLVEMDCNLPLPEVAELRVPKLALNDMPRAWYTYQSFLYPKSKGLFRR